jgi:hypothetical protein
MELQDHAATAATITVALIGRDVLIEDYDRMVETALQKGTDLWKTPR